MRARRGSRAPELPHLHPHSIDVLFVLQILFFIDSQMNYFLPLQYFAEPSPQPLTLGTGRASFHMFLNQASYNQWQLRFGEM